MASSSTRRMSWRALAPIVAIAAVGLSACSNSEEPSDTPGTTPPVWTGSPAPEGADEAHGGGAVAEEATTGAQPGEQGAGAGEELEAVLRTPTGGAAGTVTFTESGGAVEVTVELEGMPAGYRGVHVHEVGKCETNSTAPTGGAPGNYLSAGGHLQAGGNTSVPESGDLGAVVVREDGTGSLTVTTEEFTLDDLQGGDGTSVVVHEETAAGERLACGVVS
ncbi:superoxide dismutase family protein [Rhodococcus sp. GXMU-t2271]|uniref:Superoxide dismutase family protein n=1 Tax=Rhodococcus indonesiensis TaxID=3055869 RepID=A0ABT7RMT7_9NOCA|nr:superoxide dismutase family protein [Rhodococcus indonesiensis]MDM7488937.1 superoxide dismutase family protein [Rhodococcus indonesiensis]